MDIRIQKSESLSNVLFRNTLYNLSTQLILIVVAVWSIPHLVEGLSKEGFGLLSLIWATIGYFSLLDFGVSRAVTKFVAESRSTDDQSQTCKIAWTSLTTSGLIGIFSGAVIILSIPLLVNNVFHIAPERTSEASHAFLLAAVGFPFMMIFGTIKGIQMAHQRFDLVNIFQGTMGLSQWGGAVILLWLGFGLTEIMLLTVTIRICAAIISFLMLPKLVPDLFSAVSLLDRAALKKIASFGGWVSISQIVSPLFLYLDRFLVGIFLSMSAVALYTVPQEALSRVLIIPLSLTATLFPALSQQSPAEDDGDRRDRLYMRSLKYLALPMLPLAVVFIVFAKDILALWMGADFAANTALVFQILSIGLLFNVLAQVPATKLQAFGRPDLPAKFHLIELPLMVALNLLLIPWIGIVGTAIVWSFRVTLDAALLFGAAERFRSRKMNETRQIGSWRALSVQALFGGAVPVLALFVQDTPMRLALVTVCGVGYVAAMWMYGLDEIDRNFLLRLHRGIF